MVLKYTIKDTDTYQNVKEVLKAYFGISERLLLRLKNTQNILLNSKPTYVSKEVTVGDIIEVLIDFIEDNSNIVPTKMNLSIIYEDDSYLVVNKSPNMAIHPSMLHYDTSLSNGVRYYFDSINLKKKIRPVNRLDKDTSGLVIFAKNEYIQECLVSQMKTKDMKKTYIAICEGIFKEKSGTINLPIARKPGSIIERYIDESGDQAITHYEVLKELNNVSVVKCTLETGRTHQIRVHLSYLGHPILGDTLYGKKKDIISRQLLHAYKLEFIHPISKEYVSYVAPIPEDFKQFIDQV
ncbi:MAG: RluA family pseudouridine synthase [Clostridia bacterium]|nr:RluA family pseudouridine synthase [Clostridia bacterium]